MRSSSATGRVICSRSPSSSWYCLADAVARGEQLGQAAELDAHDRGLDVGEPVVVAEFVERGHRQGRHSLTADRGRDAVGVQLARVGDQVGVGVASAPPSPEVMPLRPWKLNAVDIGEAAGRRPL